MTADGHYVCQWRPLSEEIEKALYQNGILAKDELWLAIEDLYNVVLPPRFELDLLVENPMFAFRYVYDDDGNGVAVEPRPPMISVLMSWRIDLWDGPPMPIGDGDKNTAARLKFEGTKRLSASYTAWSTRPQKLAYHQTLDLNTLKDSYMTARQFLDVWIVKGMIRKIAELLAQTAYYPAPTVDHRPLAGPSTGVVGSGGIIPHPTEQETASAETQQRES